MTTGNLSLSTRGVHADHHLATNAVAADISFVMIFPELLSLFRALLT